MFINHLDFDGPSIQKALETTESPPGKATMNQFLQQLINGLFIGSTCALMAVGYSLVYSIMNFSNFAHKRDGAA